MLRKTPKNLIGACSIALALSLSLGPAFLAAHFTFSSHVYCQLHERLEHREVQSPDRVSGSPPAAELATLGILPDSEEHSGGCSLPPGFSDPTAEADRAAVSWPTIAAPPSGTRHLLLPHNVIPSLTLAPKNSPPAA